MPYYTEEYRGMNRPETVRMYFELPCLDWCRFEKSDIYLCLINYLDAIGRTYYIDRFRGEDHPEIVRMSFELLCHDWCRFEKSNVYRCLTSYLEELEKQNIPKMQKEPEDL